MMWREAMMIERICPACQHGNPLDDRFCGKCGAPLERQLPMRRPEAHLTIAGRELPVTWKQLSRTLALSVAALAAEAGVAWLRRRMDASPAPAAPFQVAPVAQPAPAETTALTRSLGSVITVVSQRIIEIRDTGDGAQRVTERTFWRRIEE
jgi:hypothetical protein